MSKEDKCLQYINEMPFIQKDKKGLPSFNSIVIDMDVQSILGELKPAKLTHYGDLWSTKPIKFGGNAMWKFAYSKMAVQNFEQYKRHPGAYISYRKQGLNFYVQGADNIRSESVPSDLRKYQGTYSQDSSVELIVELATVSPIILDGNSKNSVGEALWSILLYRESKNFNFYFMEGDAIVGKVMPRTLNDYKRTVWNAPHHTLAKGITVRMIEKSKDALREGENKYTDHII